jgi:hypothetical protein
MDLNDESFIAGVGAGAGGGGGPGPGPGPGARAGVGPGAGPGFTPAGAKEAGSRSLSAACCMYHARS